MLKKNGYYRGVVLIFFMVLLGTFILPSCKASPSSTPMMYIDPARIVGETDETYDVTVMVKDFSDLYLWQFGLAWNPEVLECIGYKAGSSLDDDVFDVLAPGVMTLIVLGEINNTLGEFKYSAQCLTGVIPGVIGEAGVSYKLMVVHFKVKASGVSDLHLTDVMLINSSIEVMPINILDVFTAWEEADLVVEVLTNSTGKTGTNIYGHVFTPEDKVLSFNLTSVSVRDFAPGGTTGFCNVTIPGDLLWVDDLAEWVVKVNGEPPLSLDEKGTHETRYFIYFTYNHIGTLINPKVLNIEIIGTHAISAPPAVPVGGYSLPIKGYTTEKPLTLYLALIGILTVSLTIAKRRKKQQN